MNRCLSERTLLRVYTRDGTVAQREHLRLCADCAERYDRLEEDLGTLRHILEAPPPVAVARQRAGAFHMGWLPIAAVATAALVVLLVSVPWLRQPPRTSGGAAAHSPTVSAFAADVSAALFADGAPGTSVEVAMNDTADLQAALDTGSLCTRDRYLNGECDDQLSALLYESE